MHCNAYNQYVLFQLWLTFFVAADGNQVLEEIRTEIRFLYQDCPPEVTTNHPKLHVGISESSIFLIRTDNSILHVVWVLFCYYSEFSH